jgi:hypothetical protein
MTAGYIENVVFTINKRDFSLSEQPDNQKIDCLSANIITTIKIIFYLFLL